MRERGREIRWRKRERERPRVKERRGGTYIERMKRGR
jgi:hypothetical protein